MKMFNSVSIMNTAILCIVFSAIFGLGNCTIPDYIHVCQRNDPELAACITKSIDILRPRLQAGIPELEIPPIEPFTLDVVSFQSPTSRATNFQTNLTNIQVYGAANFKILKLIPTLMKSGNKFRFEVILPELYINGDYQVNSRVLLLQLQGNGPFHANLSDFHVSCELKGDKIQRYGVNHIEFENMKCHAVVGKVSIVLQNLFNGNPVLERAMNDAINENSLAFFEEIKPSIISAFSKKFTVIANRITLYFKAEELFP